MQRETYFILAVLLALAAAPSCSEKGLAPAPDGEAVDYEFTMSGLKSGSASSTTYRAMLHSTSGNPGEHAYLNNSGSYRGPDTDERAWLTACEVDPNTGKWIADSHQYGLRATRGSYYLSFVSPAVAPQQYKYNETTGKYEEWGFLHHRQPQAGEPELFISSPFKINSLTGNHLEGQYVYDVPDEVELFERRAKITLKFKCGDDLVSATINKVGWSNLYESCYYNLRLDTLDTFTLSAPDEIVYVYEPASPLTMLNGQDAVEVCSDFFLFPLYYAKKDEHDEYVYESPEIDVFVAQGIARFKIYDDIKPQYSYTYTIAINSAYVSVVVTADPWDEYAAAAPVEVSGSYTVNFTLDSWDDKENVIGTIE